MISVRMNHHDSPITSFVYGFQLLPIERMERIENHDLWTYGIMTMLVFAVPVTGPRTGSAWDRRRGEAGRTAIRT